jgi:serine/threonine-protein kinase
MDPSEENLDSRIDELLRRVAHVSAAPMQAAETLEMPGSPPGPAQRPLARGVPSPGSVVEGRYRVDGMLGEGAMGVVLSAHNLRTGREVALKYMLGDEHAPYAQRCARVERFVREAQAVGRVRDPHVVDIYDVGGDLDAPYLVMERLHGHSLRERMRAGPLDEPQLIRVASEAARGVAAAHRQGVIHRDLKPDNLFLAEREGGAFTVKVLDFGVSRILDDTAVLATITRSGAIVGTPAYMPLEQLRGEHEVDARVDVYALGAIMYEALSGKLPFEGRTLHDLVLLMASDMPTPLASVAPQVSPWLCTVVMKCLSRTPDHRFPDMPALIRALEARESVPVPSLAPPEPASGPRPKRKIWPIAVLLVVLAVAAFVFLSARPTELAPEPLVAQPSPAPSSAPPPASQPTPEPARAESLPSPALAPSSPAAPVTVEPPPKPQHDEPTTRPQRQPRPRPNSAQRARDLRPEDF